ncbi:MAG: metallophosphoesterase [Pseudomonadota bacterium]
MNSVIAHISDIHFGAVDVAAARRLADDINARDVCGVIVTGDLTQAGRKREFAEAAAYLRSFEAPILAVPGNHDVPVYNLGRRFIDPWSRYRRYIHQALCPEDVFGDIYVIGLNSARRAGPSLDWSLGRLSRSQIALARRALEEAQSGLKIVALHHPVVPRPGRAGQAVIDQPARALDAFSAGGADVVLTGHAHIAQTDIETTEHGPLVISSAGTASSTRTRGEGQSYNLLYWSDGSLIIETLRFDGTKYAPNNSHSFERAAHGWRPQGDA